MKKINKEQTLEVFSNKKALVFFTFLILVMIIGTSYALWQLTFRQETTNTITTGCFKLEFQDNNPINLQEALPITDEEGKKLTPYQVTVTNICDTLVKYQINLDILNTTNLNNHSYIKSQFEDNSPVMLTSLETVTPTVENATISYNLETGVLSKLGSKTFNLRLWLNETTPSNDEMMNKTFESKVVINTVQSIDKYTEDILNGADPILKDELIPVIIAPNGDVTKANIKEEWYNYEEKQWANAVILKDKGIEYADGANIPESNIESYFVWIPRYRYKIFNDEKYTGLTDIDSTKVQTIEVEFESKDVTPSVGNKKNEWLTHPAFTSFNANGMWVGKFETSKSDNTPDNSRSFESVQIKPSVVSWRNIQAGNAFYASYGYQRNLDSHMMKNSEWGAVAYLQHSKYGSSKSVRINNNSNFLTGYSSTTEPTCGYTADNRTCNKYGTTSDITRTYNTEIGYLASTTGNISGIYDMSGGVFEFTMGIMIDINGKPLSGGRALSNSGFIGEYGEGGSLTSGYSWPNDKYYDKYTNGTNYSEYTRGHFGDATFEIGPFRSIIYANNNTRQISSWYANDATIVNTTGPWFIRGGDHRAGTDSGMFAFGNHSGAIHDYGGFRIVLTP